MPLSLLLKTFSDPLILSLFLLLKIFSILKKTRIINPIDIDMVRYPVKKLSFEYLSRSRSILTICKIENKICPCIFPSIFETRRLNIFNNKKRLKIRGSEKVFNSSESGTQENQYKRLGKKYEFMFGDFKRRSAHQFFFTYWIIAYDAVYILLIFSLQSLPVLQCLSIVILVLVLIMFSAVIKPFKKKSTAFMHFFGFSCVLIAGILNLILAIIDTLNLDYLGANEIQGKFIVSIIILNTAMNMMFAFGGLLFELYKKVKRKKKLKIKNRR